MGKIKTRAKMAIAGSLVTAGVMSGVGLGAGQAEAKIEEGRYKSYGKIYGFVPVPPANVRVIGNRMYTDYYGSGPWNLTNSLIIQRPWGGTVSTGTDPVSLWNSRIDYYKTSYGYRGVSYAAGVPLAETELRRVR